MFYKDSLYEITFEDHSLKMVTVLMLGSSVPTLLEFLAWSATPVHSVTLTGE